MDVHPPIRTSPQTASRPHHDGNSTIRMIVKLLREVVTRQRFTDYADVKDALRRRLTSLRIRYRQVEFDDAWPIVASNLPLVSKPKPRELVERPVEDLNLSKFDAVEALAEIRKRYGKTPTVRTMPQARSVRDVDRAKAAQMIAAEIVASVARCEALERER